MVLPRLAALAEQYVITTALGQAGPFDLTYQAIDLQSQEAVVVQEYFPTRLAARAPDGTSIIPGEAFVDFAAGLRYFENEGAVLKEIAHPSLLPELDCFRANGTAYRVRPMLAGTSLADRIARGEVCSDEGVRVLLGGLLEGLEHAHEKGMLHGGIAPKTILLSEERGLVLISFRAAHLVLAQQYGGLAELVEPGFSAPELEGAGGKIGPWTDVYAAAAVGCYMLTGQVPPSAAQRRAEDGVPALLQASGAAAAVQGALLQALALPVEQRPPSAEAFRKRLLGEAPASPSAGSGAEEVPPDAAGPVPSSTAPQAAQVPVPPPPPEATSTARGQAPSEAEAPPEVEASPLGPASPSQEARSDSHEESSQPVADREEPPQAAEDSSPPREELSPRQRREPHRPKKPASTARETRAPRMAEPPKAEPPKAEPPVPAARRRGWKGIAALVVVLLLVGAAGGGVYFMRSEGGRVDSVEAQYQDLRTLGDSLLALSDYAGALAHFQQALRLRPEDPYALERRQQLELLLQAGQPQGEQGAEETWSPEGAVSAVERQRRELYARYTQQGDAYIDEGRYAQARVAFRKALEARPGDAYANDRLAAIEVYWEQVRREARYTQHLERGDELLRKRDLEAAREEYVRAQRLEPEDAAVRGRIAEVDSLLAAAEGYERYRAEGDRRAAEGDCSAAASAYEQALALRPGDANVSEKLQACYRDVAVEDRRDEQGVYSVADEPPQLIGELADLYRQVNYPVAAVERRIEGQVFVQFVVDEKGRVHDPRVVRGIGGGCDEEAVRVVQRARFRPGRIGGKPVKVRHSLPFPFRLGT